MSGGGVEGLGKGHMGGGGIFHWGGGTTPQGGMGEGVYGLGNDGP